MKEYQEYQNLIDLGRKLNLNEADKVIFESGLKKLLELVEEAYDTGYDDGYDSCYEAAFVNND